jgi:hypothetical protein
MSMRLLIQQQQMEMRTGVYKCDAVLKVARGRVEGKCGGWELQA